MIVRSRVLAAAALTLGGVLLASPAAAAEACPVADATITWGFKESFRSYLSGTIANGEWIVTEPVTYETPEFGFAGGDGDYDGGSGAGSVVFDGRIQFTGHGGILDTTISAVELRFVDGGRAILVADVSGTTQAGDPVDARAVEFVSLDLTGVATLEGSTIMITDAPATLTADGAAAFGTYLEGETFDPLSATLPLDASCAALAAPPLPVWPFWLGGGALALGAAALVAGLVVRRARRS